MQWPPTPGPGRKRHEPERLGRRRVDDLPDVEAHPLAQQGELVDERDVDVAEHVLEELRELGGVRRRELDDRGVDVAQERRRAGRRRPGSSRRRGAGRPLGAGRVARVHPLRREGEVEVAAGDEPGLLERLAERAGGRARERRRLEDDELAGAEVGADDGRPRRRTGPRSGSLAWVIGVGTHTNDRIGRRRGRRSAGAVDREAGREAGPQPRVVDVVDRRAALAQLVRPGPGWRRRRRP